MQLKYLSKQKFDILEVVLHRERKAAEPESIPCQLLTGM
jgi:hypothetical protein